MNVSYELVGFDYQKKTDIEQIKRNLDCLYSCAEGTCPGDRSFGLNQDFLSLPLPVAQNKLSLEIIQKTEKYEPSVEVMDIQYSFLDGRLSASVRLEPARKVRMGG